MSDEIVIELARLARVAERNVHERMAAEQKGEAFEPESGE